MSVSNVRLFYRTSLLHWKKFQAWDKHTSSPYSVGTLILTWSCPCYPAPPFLPDRKGSGCKSTHRASHHPLRESDLQQTENTSDCNTRENRVRFLSTREGIILKNRSSLISCFITHPLSCFPKVARFSLNLVGCEREILMTTMPFLRSLSIATV